MNNTPSPAALKAAQEIVDVVNLDGARKLNNTAVIHIARIIDKHMAAERRMDWLDDALNSGDGTYRP